MGSETTNIDAGQHLLGRDAAASDAAASMDSGIMRGGITRGISLIAVIIATCTAANLPGTGAITSAVIKVAAPAIAANLPIVVIDPIGATGTVDRAEVLPGTITIDVVRTAGMVIYRGEVKIPTVDYDSPHDTTARSAAVRWAAAARKANRPGSIAWNAKWNR